MKSNRLIAAALLLAALCSGCATVDKTAFSSESKKHIKTVAFVTVPEPEKYFLDPGQAPGGFALYAFGALGGLVLGGIEAARVESATNEFTSAIKPTTPALAQQWNEGVMSLLQAKGYEVTQIPALLQKTDGKEVDCSSIAGKFDAVFLSSFTAGYAIGSTAEPRVGASVLLMSGNCATKHFSDAFIYSAKPSGQLTHVERDAKFSFQSRDALIANPEMAKQALRTGLNEITKKAMTDF